MPIVVDLVTAFVIAPSWSIRDHSNWLTAEEITLVLEVIEEKYDALAAFLVDLVCRLLNFVSVGICNGMFFSIFIVEICECSPVYTGSVSLQIVKFVACTFIFILRGVFGSNEFHKILWNSIEFICNSNILIL